MEENFEKIIPISEPEECECPPELKKKGHGLDCRFYGEIEEESPQIEVVLGKKEQTSEKKEIIISKEIKLEIESMLRNLESRIKSLTAGYNVDKISDLQQMNREKLSKYAKEIIEDEVKACRNCVSNDYYAMVEALRNHSGNLVGLTKEVYDDAINKRYPSI